MGLEFGVCRWRVCGFSCERKRVERVRSLFRDRGGVELREFFVLVVGIVFFVSFGFRVS